MHSLLPNEQRRRVLTFLSHQRTGIISTFGRHRVIAMPVRYRPHAVPSAGGAPRIDCLVPRWADVAHHLASKRPVVLIVQGSSTAGLRWLQLQGPAQPLEAPEWNLLLPRFVSTTDPTALYLVARLVPSRIDLIDEDLGWGVQETLEW
jgi:hypothetical protein